MTVDTLLSLLDKVKQTGPGRWIACCSAHDDKTPSLSIRETEDGVILLHCFSGCSASDIVGSVGLNLSDLFPKNISHHGKQERSPFNPRDVLRIMARESLVASVGAAQLAKGELISPEDAERLMLASERLQKATEVANGKL